MIKFSKEKYNKKRFEYLSNLFGEDINTIKNALLSKFDKDYTLDLSKYTDNDVKRALNFYFKNKS